MINKSEMGFTNRTGNLYGIIYYKHSQAMVLLLAICKFFYFRWFRSAITQITTLYDDSYLVVGAADGSIIVFKLKKVNETTYAPELATFEDVVITRKQLIDQIQTIRSMEQRIAEQLAEFQYQKQEGDTFQSELIREIHVDYCSALEDLRKVNTDLEESHLEKLVQAQIMMDEIKENHKLELKELEEKSNEKIGYEHSRAEEIQTNMDVMRIMYEDKLEVLSNEFQDIIQALEADAKKQLQERQSLLRDIMKELYAKKAEFTQYCSSVNVDQDRKVIELKVNYETSIANQQNQLEANSIRIMVLEKELLNMSVNCEKLHNEKEMILNERKKNKKHINKLQIEMEELWKEIHDRDQTIQKREKKLNICEKRNQELEKEKDVLNFKIDNLNAETEPRTQQIAAQSTKIQNLEIEVENIFKYGSKMEQKLSEFRDKLNANEIALEDERNKRRAADAALKKISRDIYLVSTCISNPKVLNQRVTELHQRCVTQMLIGQINFP